MQTLSQMWGSAPGTFLLLAALAAALLMVVLSCVVDIIKAVIDGVIRLFHGYPESQRVSIPLDEDDSDFGDDDEDEDHPGIGMTDRQMQCLADRLVGEIVPKALIEVSRHADLLDRLALNIADRQNELNADATADDALVAKIADAVRDRVNEVNISATDIQVIAATAAAAVMDAADQRRAEREAAKAGQKTHTLEGIYLAPTSFAVSQPQGDMLVVPATTPEPPKFGVGDKVCSPDSGDIAEIIAVTHGGQRYTLKWCDSLVGSWLAKSVEQFDLVEKAPTPAAT